MINKRIIILALASGMVISAGGCSAGSDSRSSDSVIIYTHDNSETSESSETEAVSETASEAETEDLTESETETKKRQYFHLTQPDETTEDATVDGSESESETDSEGESENETETETESESESETETEKETQPETTEATLVGLSAVAQVENYVNVRTEPNTGSSIVGKIYNNCAATILEEVDGEGGVWYYMTSGNVTGYIKAEFFVTGDAAEALRETIGKTFATIINDYTRVRTTPTLDTMDNVVTMYRAGTEVAVVGVEGDFVIIETDAASTGYVHSSCIQIVKKFDVAISIEEEQAKIAEQQRREEEARAAREAYELALAQASQAAEESSRQQSLAESSYNQSVAESIAIQQSIEASIAAAQTATEPTAPVETVPAETSTQPPETQPVETMPVATTTTPAPETTTTPAPETTTTPAAETTTASDVDTALRNAIVNYAVQFEGNPYVHAGRSLITGTDCSGFTHLVYQQFGITIGWSPSTQSTQGVQIPYTEAKPGDLLFYSNSVKYLGHVALYIGDGKIIHACNEQYGICIWDMMYREPLFAVRYF